MQVARQGSKCSSVFQRHLPIRERRDPAGGEGPREGTEGPEGGWRDPQCGRRDQLGTCDDNAGQVRPRPVLVQAESRGQAGGRLSAAAPVCIPWTRYNHSVMNRQLEVIRGPRLAYSSEAEYSPVAPYFITGDHHRIGQHLLICYADAFFVCAQSQHCTPLTC